MGHSIADSLDVSKNIYAAVPYIDKIYAIGGTDASGASVNTVEIYNLSTEWTSCSSII